MIDITKSYSLTEFQRNAKGFIEGLSKNSDPLLLTVNGKIQAVLVDPARYQAMEEQIERERFIAAVKEGLRDIDEGRTKPLETVHSEMKAKHGF
jgi:PHD/YefM family antitoxin component YafN of YafNO toxin-antitoxin module